MGTIYQNSPDILLNMQHALIDFWLKLKAYVRLFLVKNTKNVNKKPDIRYPVFKK